MEKKVIDKADALALIEREEGHFWDHKSAASSGSTIQKIASALANSDGGEFIVGIEDRKKANGIARWRGFASVEDATPVLEALARDVTPPVPYSIDFLAIIGQDQAGITCHVFVRKSESVHYAADKRVYVRRGASTAAIEGRAITDLSLSKGARSYEDQLLSEFQLDDLIGEEELAYFLKSYSPSTAPSDFATKQRLVERESGGAKVAAAMLYASSPPAVMPKRCAVKIARYNTSEEAPKRDHLVGTPVTIEGPARVLADETIRHVTELVESVSVLRPDGTMAPLTYPPEALKEIIVNAIIHRDYNVSDDILVSVFNNRVEVKSPGALPGHMTLENLLKERFARNPTIVRLLNKYPNPLNKDIGEGLRTVVDKMTEARLKPPTFRVDGSYFVVKLGHTPLARPQEIVLEYLQAHHEITNATARKLTGITSENAMKDVFYSLRDTGKLERVPNKQGNKSAWRLVDPTRQEPQIGVQDDILENVEQVLAEVDSILGDPNGRMSGPTEAGRRDRQIKLLRSGSRHFNARPGRSPARNDPCSCGSGKKFKKCHGSPKNQ